MSEASLQENVSVESLVAQVADEFMARQKNGERPNIEEYAARHPEAAELLRKVLTALAVIDFSQCGALAAMDGGEPTGALGDFRIVREVGRGGMGIVYEAEQISLHRRVALKVLPFAATMDPRHLQRFHNEAQAAACLHHGNIVPVYFVGCERGVHFYAMQFIDGQPLSEVIHQLCGQEKKDAKATAGEQTTAYQPPPDDAIAAAPTVYRAADATPLTVEGRRSRAFFHKVAELGVQAAEALDHAHQVGIVHRDVKPANLLVDARGNLWVTDFGLAQMQSDTRLTRTGDLAGTLRYMSPEQALAKRVVIDHRTDLYSLGATLYELLTLQPAFAGEDREALLRWIAFEEPKRPRQVERAIPTELETIVQKAMEKRPQDRYGTAHELADDLRRWLLDQPIRARQPSWVQVARKWTRRHQAAVRAASLMVVALLAFGIGFSLWWVRQQAAAETEARAAFDEAVRWQKRERWSEALSAIRRAQGVLRGFGSDARLRQQIDERGKDVEMAQRLEEAQLLGTMVTEEGNFDFRASVTDYAAAFAWYGLDVKHGDAGAAGEFIRSRSISKQLVAALDRWVGFQGLSGGQERKPLLAVARAADSNEWRNRFRNAWECGDSKAINDLLDSAEVEDLLPTTLSLLHLSADRKDVFVQKNVSGERVAALLRRAQQRHPDDFWINHELAVLLRNAEPPQLEEAIRHFMIAVALRPQSPGEHDNLGSALRERGRLDEAIAEFREAIRLKTDYADAHNNLGNALHDKGRLDEAIAEHHEAIRLKPDHAKAHSNLGVSLHGKGRLDEAIAECREAIRLDKDDAVAHLNLGSLLQTTSRLNEAIAEYREAIRIKPKLAEVKWTPLSRPKTPNSYLLFEGLSIPLACTSAGVRYPNP